MSGLLSRMASIARGAGSRIASSAGSFLQAGGMKYILSTVAAQLGTGVMDVLQQSNLMKPFALYGTFIFGIQFPALQSGGISGETVWGVPPPTKLSCRIKNKLVEIPIVGMLGNRLQRLGREAPVVEMEGYFLAPFAANLLNTFEDMEKLGVTLPFFTSIIPIYRMMQVDEFVYEGTRHQRDIKYKLVLKQDREYGYP